MIITGVAIFLLILTVSGVVSARRVRGDCSNYLVAGRALPAAVVAAVLIAQPVDSNATIGNADLSAAFGFWAGAALPIGLALCLLLMGLFFAKRMRTADVVTLPEYFRNRFGRATEVASSYLTIASFIILLAGNLVAIGFLLERFVGVSYAYGILLTIPLALLYTITGGMFASVYTGVTCVIVNIIGVVSLVTWVGTTHGFSAPEGMGAGDLAQLTSSESGAVINWATIIALGLGNLVAIDLMQRVFSARSPRGAQNACFAAAAGILMLCIPLSFVALAAVSIVGDAAADGPILYTLLAQYAPVWLAIIVISGLLAATLTTVSGILLATAAVLVRNVLRIDGDAPVMTPRVLRATRWATLPMAVLAGVVALRVPQTGILLTLSFDLLLASLVVPFILGLYWSRGGAPPRLGAAIVVGIGVRLTFFVLTPTIYGVDNTLFYVPNEWVTTAADGWSTLLAGAASLIAYVAVAAFTSRPVAPVATAEPEIQPALGRADLGPVLSNIPHVSILPTWQDRHVRTPASGRPRLEERKRPGKTARDEVLDAAAELFTTLGVAATSTRQIAEAVGIRQASLYHHFRTKNDILASLLSGTVVSSLKAAHQLRDRPEPAVVLLHALSYLDCRLLWDSPWNLGILYLLPEVRDPQFDEFHRQRTELRNAYHDLSRRVLADLNPPAPDALDIGVDGDVVFRLVETLPNLRVDGLGVPDQPQRTADLAVHLLGWRGDWAALRAASQMVATKVR